MQGGKQICSSELVSIFSACFKYLGVGGLDMLLTYTSSCQGVAWTTAIPA